MSPEQAQGEAVDYRSDLFSPGQRPVRDVRRKAVRATGTMAVLKRLRGHASASREVNAEIQHWLKSDIIMKLHAKNQRAFHRRQSRCWAGIWRAYSGPRLALPVPVGQRGPAEVDSTIKPIGQPAGAPPARWNDVRLQAL